MLDVRGRWRPVALAIFGFVCLTAVYAWPLLVHLRHAVVHDPVDPLLNAWILWWTTKAVPLSARWWNAPMFVPAPGTFAFSEHLLGLAPIAAPIIALTGSALLAYNVTLLATFVLSGLGGYVLGYTLTRRHDAAFVSGVAFAFTPYRVAQLSHLQVLSAFWIPVCIAALHQYDREPRIGWAALAAWAWLMQALSNGYYLFFLAVFVALWLLWFAAGKWSLRKTVVLLVWFAGAALVLAPVLIGYEHVLVDVYGFSRGVTVARFFGADIASILTASPDLWLWGWLHAIRKPEGELFPGVTILLLACYAMWRRPGSAPKRHGDHAWRRTRMALAAVIVLSAVAAVLPAVFGSWHLSIGRLQLVSISRADKPLTLTAWCAIAWAITLPATIASWRSRSMPTFYLLAAVAMWVLALGPAPEFLGHRAIYQAPYALLLLVPGFDGLRVPPRFWMMSVTCLAALAACAIARVPERRRRLLTTAAVIGLMLDAWPKPFPLVSEPEARATPAGVSVRLNLPMTNEQSAAGLYQQTRDRVPVPLYNGYSGFEAPHEFAMRELLDAGDGRILQAMTRRGPLAIVIDHDADAEGTARKMVASYPTVSVIEMHDRWSSYRLPATRGDDLLPDAAGQPLRIKGLTAAPSKYAPSLAIDGDVATRWSAGAQLQPAEMIAELERPSFVHQIVIDLGTSSKDFPAHLDIDVSSDARSWTSAWSGDTALHAYYGALRHPKVIPLVFQIDRAGVRFVRLRQTGMRKDDWSIAELHVLS